MKKIFTLIVVASLAMGMILPSASAAVIVTPSAASVTEPGPEAVKSALEAYKNLSKKEKKELNKEVKKALKKHKSDMKNQREPVVGTLVQVLAAILFPPLGVYLHEGEINKRFWISLVLTLLFYVPGLIYALIVILGGGESM
jgi:uncharacterized membrane protein YqaE (UPF0057 family)